MLRSRRPSPKTTTVLTVLADDPTAWQYCYELGLETGLRPGSLYPILIRLCDRGLLETGWETDPPPGRVPRHRYRLTDTGAALAHELAAASASASTTGTRRGQQLRGAW